jgi:hypothetical protein
MCVVRLSKNSQDRHPEIAEGKAQDLSFLPKEGLIQNLKLQVRRLGH